MNAARFLNAAIAGVVVVVAAASARADFASSGTITEFLPGDYIDNVPPDNSGVKANAADGQFVFDKTLSPLAFGGEFIDFLAQFTAGQTPLQVGIYTGSVSGVYLSAVDFINSGNGTFASVQGLNIALAPNARNDVAFTLGTSGGVPLTLVNGPFTTYDQIALDFAFDNPGDRLALDAVANPEPGTWALYGLGVVALGGFARRRRARSAKAAG